MQTGEPSEVSSRLKFAGLCTVLKGDRWYANAKIYTTEPKTEAQSQEVPDVGTFSMIHQAQIGRSTNQDPGGVDCLHATS